MLKEVSKQRYIKQPESQPVTQDVLSDSSVSSPVISKQPKSFKYSWRKILLTSMVAAISAALFVIFPPAGLAAAVSGLGAIGGAATLIGVGVVVGAIAGTLAVNAIDLGKNIMNNVAKISPVVANNMRNKISTNLTSKKVNALKEKTSQLASDENSPLLNSSYKNVENRLVSDSPKKILTEARAEYYKVEDNAYADESVGLTEDVEKTFKP